MDIKNIQQIDKDFLQYAEKHDNNIYFIPKKIIYSFLIFYQRNILYLKQKLFWSDNRLWRKNQTKISNMEIK